MRQPLSRPQEMFQWRRNGGPCRIFAWQSGNHLHPGLGGAKIWPCPSTPVGEPDLGLSFGEDRSFAESVVVSNLFWQTPGALQQSKHQPRTRRNHLPVGFSLSPSEALNMEESGSLMSASVVLGVLPLETSRRVGCRAVLGEILAPCLGWLSPGQDVFCLLLGPLLVLFHHQGPA